MNVQYSNVYHVFVYNRGFQTSILSPSISVRLFLHDSVQTGFGTHTSLQKITAADSFHGFCLS